LAELFLSEKGEARIFRGKIYRPDVGSISNKPMQYIFQASAL
jgi:hypothetical protein